MLCALGTLLVIACSPAQEEKEAAKDVPQEKGVAERADEEASSDRTKTYSLGIYPEKGYRGTVFRALPDNFSLSDSRVEWIMDGGVVEGEQGREFQPQDIEKGSTVQVRAVVNGTEVVSEVVTILNTPPVISNVVLRPETSLSGLVLMVEVDAHDPDDDEVALSYEWIKNREPAGNGSRMEVPVRRGDDVRVTITPFDGSEYGRPEVIQRTIHNTLPIIYEDDIFTFDGGIYSFQVRAVDPDGDTLVYSLKSGPEGMSIDADTGYVKWNVPEEFTGEVPVTVAVSDSEKGEITRELTLVIEQEEETEQ